MGIKKIRVNERNKLGKMQQLVQTSVCRESV
jgi:hypothetical protein